MKTSLTRLGLIAFTSLCIAGGVTRYAWAQQKLTCDMSGTWFPDNDSYAFIADYVVRNGPDTFSGVYVNSSAGATAKVNGTANNGHWSIALIYTDAKHKGYEKYLTGEGTRQSNNTIVIKGDFTAKKSGSVVQKGTFVMNGKCK